MWASHSREDDDAVFRPWRWRQYVCPKHLYLPESLHGAKTQNNNIVKN
jgi:hypothetical protein